MDFDDGLPDDYANRKYLIGDFEGSFLLGTSKKTVKIVFPHSLIGSITKIELVGASYVSPIQKQKKIIFYGDSITQGYDALHPSKTYAYLLGESLDADIMNK